MTAGDWPPLPEAIPTPRSLLRPFSVADADDVYVYRRDPEIVQFLPVSQPFERADADHFVATQVLADPRERCVWALEHEGHVVGGVSLRIARQQLRAEIGYELARWLWGRGIMTEAVSDLVDIAFRRLPILKVSATAAAPNVRSTRLLQRLGMQREALLRRHWVHRGRILDELRYGLLREEWERNDIANSG